MNNFRLLIHHHAVAFVDADGGICLPSFIGRWVDALSLYYDEVGLLLHQSQQLYARQDEKVLRPNVHLISLGPPGRTWDHFSRIRRIRKVCQSETTKEDILLVRGITPRQSVVWQSVKSQQKAFLLVGTPNSYPLAEVHTLNDLWSFVISRYRIEQLRKILHDGIALVNAPNLVSLLATQFGVQANFIPTNSIRLDEFMPSAEVATRKLSHPLHLLFCGRVTRSKGIIEILEALVLLRKAGLECVLDVIGSAGEDNQLEVFQNLAKELGVNELVHWRGLVPFGPMLFEYYRTADVFLFPTHYEGFPHVLWEAAANGCAIVTSPVGGIPSLMTDGEHAVFIPHHNAHAAFNAVSLLSQNEDLRKKNIAAAYSLACEYSVEKCASQLASRLKRGYPLDIS
jgi:glycosyltransferase involved in cell wall biosynthesis